MKCPLCNTPFPKLLVESDDELECKSCSKMTPCPAGFEVKREGPLFEVTWREPLGSRLTNAFASIFVLGFLSLFFALLLDYLFSSIEVGRLGGFSLWLLGVIVSFGAGLTDKRVVTLRATSQLKSNEPYRRGEVKSGELTVSKRRLFRWRRHTIKTDTISQLYTARDGGFALIARCSNNSLFTLLTPLDTEAQCRYIEEQIEARLQIRNEEVDPEKAPRPKPEVEKPRGLHRATKGDELVLQWRKESLGETFLLGLFFVFPQVLIFVEFLYQLIFGQPLLANEEVAKNSVWGALFTFLFIGGWLYFSVPMFIESLLNYHKISAAPGLIKTYYGPFPRAEVSELSTEKLSQIYCCIDALGDDSPDTYKLLALGRDGTLRPLIKDNSSADILRYVEAQLEAHLKIEDAPVEGEYKRA